jgi:soluble lytic murein transglycosylase
MIWAVLALAALAGLADPRIEIVRAQLDGDPRQTLELVERHVEEDPDTAARLGLYYLQGDLLEQLGRARDADTAFAAALSSNPGLAAHSRYRLALSQAKRGHPEVAAGLAATLLARDPPASLIPPAARLLFESVRRGGDCRLLRGLDGWRLDTAARRLLQVSANTCGVRAPESSQLSALFALLADDSRDEAARHAAEHLASARQAEGASAADLALTGQALHHQRRFEVATDFLTRALAGVATEGDSQQLFREARYALARSLFWRERYLDAAAEFGRVAAGSDRAEDSARAFYQQGRAFELHGSWQAALSSFRMAYLENPAGRWADAALLSALRIEWRHGEQQEALRLFDALASRREWSTLFGKAAIFLASSDLALGRSDRAAAWLTSARRADRELHVIADYWTGRLAELDEDWAATVAAYSQVLAADSAGPLAHLARSRLSRPELEDASGQLAASLARGRDTASLYRAWLLLESASGDALTHRLQARYARAASAFFTVEFVAPEAWTIWRVDLRRPEELLLAMGLFSEGASAVPRHFPPSDVRLGYTGSRLLSRAGAHRRALNIAETLLDGATAAMAPEFVPVLLRRAAYPLPYGALTAEQAARYGIDPYLLTAILREESRFDPDAVSAASARGLSQLVLPTARRLAASQGLRSPSPEDLHNPAVSIALGAAYLAELQRRFDNRRFQIVAAYNAGERQAELWRSYCFTPEPAEYLSKVGFPETQRYLRRVLTSRTIYLDLYPAETFVVHSSPAASEPTTSAGSAVSASSR